MARFELGVVCATPGALDLLREYPEAAANVLSRHASGDWGEVCAEDARENERSVRHGWRILSAYTLATGEKVWIITEADRSSTCILRPEEY